MNKIESTVRYLIGNYPYRLALSEPRLRFMIYLADWRMAIDHGATITDLHWYCGPRGPDGRIGAFAEESTELSEMLWEILREDRSAELSGNLESLERKTLDKVIETARECGWFEFSGLVYGTRPVTSTPEGQEMDLAEIAGEYVKK